jgi:hypothetical protein
MDLPPRAGVLEEIVLLPIQQYILQTIQKYVSSRPIYELCLCSKPLARNLRPAVWWKHQMVESQTVNYRTLNALMSR